MIITGATGVGKKGDKGDKGSKIYFEQVTIPDLSLVTNTQYLVDDIIIDNQGTYFEITKFNDNTLHYVQKFNISSSSIVDFLLSKFQYDSLSGNVVNKWSYKQPSNIFDTKGTLLLINRNILSSNDQAELFRLVIGDDRLPVTQNASLTLVNILPNEATTTNYDGDPFTQLAVKYRKLSNGLVSTPSAYHIFREDVLNNPYYEIRNTSVSVALKHNAVDDNASEFIVRGRKLSLLGNKADISDISDLFQLDVGPIETSITAAHDVSFIVNGVNFKVNSTVIQNTVDTINYIKKSSVPSSIITEIYNSTTLVTVTGNHEESISGVKIFKTNNITNNGSGSDVNLNLTNANRIIDNRVYKRTKQVQWNYVTLDCSSGTVYDTANKTLIINTTGNDFILTNIPAGMDIQKIVCSGIDAGTTVTLWALFGSNNMFIRHTSSAATNTIFSLRNADITAGGVVSTDTGMTISLTRTSGGFWYIKDYSQSAKLDQYNVYTGVNEYRSLIAGSTSNIAAAVTIVVSAQQYLVLPSLKNNYEILTGSTAVRIAGLSKSTYHTPGTIITLTIYDYQVSNTTFVGITCTAYADFNDGIAGYGFDLGPLDSVQLKLISIGSGGAANLRWLVITRKTKTIDSAISSVSIADDLVAPTKTAVRNALKDLDYKYDFGLTNLKYFDNTTDQPYHLSIHSDAYSILGGNAVWGDPQQAQYFYRQIGLVSPTPGLVYFEVSRFTTAPIKTREYKIDFTLGLIHAGATGTGSVGPTYTPNFFIGLWVRVGGVDVVNFNTPNPAIKISGGKGGETTAILRNRNLGFIAPGTLVQVRIAIVTTDSLTSGNNFLITHLDQKILGDSGYTY